MRSNKSPGQLKENGVVLLPQEKRAVNYLIEHGLDITLIPPSLYPGVKTPDLITRIVCLGKLNLLPRRRTVLSSTLFLKVSNKPRI